MNRERTRKVQATVWEKGREAAIGNVEKQTETNKRTKGRLV